jgi:hypothetical protein
MFVPGGDLLLYWPAEKWFVELRPKQLAWISYVILTPLTAVVAAAAVMMVMS